MRPSVTRWRRSRIEVIASRRFPGGPASHGIAHSKISGTGPRAHSPIGGDQFRRHSLLGSSGGDVTVPVLPLRGRSRIFLVRVDQTPFGFGMANAFVNDRAGYFFAAANPFFFHGMVYGRRGDEFRRGSLCLSRCTGEKHQADQREEKCRIHEITSLSFIAP